MSTTRVRFAPSPTGYLHIGGLRTALYNYLFARREGGKFVLRIEDTDRTRIVDDAVRNLIDTLKWAGLEHDEGPEAGGPFGPYVQSQRLDIYKKYVMTLIDQGKAYYAFDTPEELSEMRRLQGQKRIPPKYDRRALRLSPEEVQEKLERGVPSVVRMKVPESRPVRFVDLIRGEVEFSSDRLDDQVILKSDGYPTYHLANVVDDHLMKISHVIRGEEWISSTPKHVLLYEYLGWDLPAFAHLPLLLNTDKSKLSKRQGDVAVEDYRSKGYLREALLNFVALLGWNPGDERELFSLEDLVREFSLERVGKSGAVFNIEKLKWMNTQHTRAKSVGELLTMTLPEVRRSFPECSEPAYVSRVLTLVRDRLSAPSDLVDQFGYFFRTPDSYADEVVKKNWKSETGNYMKEVLGRLKGLEQFSEEAIEKAIRQSAQELGIGTGKVIHPLRLCLTGVSVGPGLFEMMAVLGKETCLKRIESGTMVLTEQKEPSHG